MIIGDKQNKKRKYTFYQNNGKGLSVMGSRMTDEKESWEMAKYFINCKAAMELRGDMVFY